MENMENQASQPQGQVSQGQVSENNGAGTSAGTQNADNQSQPKNNEVMIPKARFDEVNNKYKETANQLKELQKQLQAFQEAQKQAEIEAQKEQGKYRELYEGLNSEYESLKGTLSKFEARAQELEGYIAQMLEAKLENIPEDQRDLIPDGLTPEQKLAWLEKAEAKGLFGRRPDMPIGEGTNPTQQPTQDISELSAFQKILMGYGRK